MTILPHYFSTTGPGAALGVVFDEKPPIRACVGLADLELKTRITADTVFELASASKIFTATGIMFQFERGHLDLSAPVTDYLPHIDKPEMGREITIRDLLSHTSGLKDYLESLGYSNPGYGLPLVESVEIIQLDTVGDGGVFSSLNDLIRWQTLFWNAALVSEKSLRLMRTQGKLDTGQNFNYGLGLQVEIQGDGQTWYGHGGSWVNSTTIIGRYEKQRTSVILLSNELGAPVERISQRALVMMG